MSVASIRGEENCMKWLFSEISPGMPEESDRHWSRERELPFLPYIIVNDWHAKYYTGIFSYLLLIWWAIRIKITFSAWTKTWAVSGKAGENPRSIQDLPGLHRGSIYLRHLISGTTELWTNYWSSAGLKFNCANYFKYERNYACFFMLFAHSSVTTLLQKQKTIW